MPMLDKIKNVLPHTAFRRVIDDDRGGVLYGRSSILVTGESDSETLSHGALTASVLNQEEELTVLGDVWSKRQVC